MGLFQEAAILAGDLITQPIRKGIVEVFTGKKVQVKKIVEKGVLMKNGSLNADFDFLKATQEVLQSQKPVLIHDFGTKRVSWELEFVHEK